MGKVFDEDFYTDDFDQDMIDYLVDSGWVVQDNDSRDARVDNLYLRFGSSQGYFWTTDNSYDFNLGKLLTKQQFKEKIGMTTGYKLADGSYSSKYKVGDKFEVVRVPNLSEHYNRRVGSIITLIDDDGTDSPYFDDEFICVGWHRLKPYKEPAKQFTKSDLLDGMRVLHRDGYERVVLGDKLYVHYTNSLEHRAYLSEFQLDLTYVDGPSMDIIKVTDRDGTVLFTRQEAPAKSPAQIELDKLQEQIAQLQEQANKLQQKL